MPSSRKRAVTRSLGFTLIELLVVLAIIALLLTLAVPRYWGSVDVAKERVLQENIKTTRIVIQQFLGDNGRYPHSLDELVEKRYLKAIPVDPITEQALKVVEPPQGQIGTVYDVKAQARGRSRSGKLYEEF